MSRVASIDVGSNSVLLAVEELDQNGWREIFSDSAVTALGEDVKKSKTLKEPNMVATAKAIDDFAQEAEQMGANPVLIAGAMALRIAENREEFINRIRDQGREMIVLTGEQEAALGFESVVYDPAFANSQLVTIIDPGGQSTEIVTASRQADGAWATQFRKSFAVGTLGLRSEVLSDEAPNPGALVAASAMIDEIFDLHYGRDDAGQVVVLGATGVNLVSLRDHILEYDPALIHGAKLTYEEVSTAVGRLSQLTDEERRNLPGMEPGRERTIHIGSLILERAMFGLCAVECSVSVRGWRNAWIERGLPNRDGTR